MSNKRPLEEYSLACLMRLQRVVEREITLRTTLIGYVKYTEHLYDWLDPKRELVFSVTDASFTPTKETISIRVPSLDSTITISRILSESEKPLRILQVEHDTHSNLWVTLNWAYSARKRRHRWFKMRCCICLNKCSKDCKAQEYFNHVRSTLYFKMMLTHFNAYFDMLHDINID
jgi:hypothetical protein